MLNVYACEYSAEVLQIVTDSPLRPRPPLTHSVDSQKSCSNVARASVGCRASRCKKRFRLNDECLSAGASDRQAHGARTVSHAALQTLAKSGRPSGILFKYAAQLK